MVSKKIVWRQGGKWYFLWRFYVKTSLDTIQGFYGENMANLITRMVSMKIVWRQGGEWYFLWRCYVETSLDTIQGFYGEKMANQITRQFSNSLNYKISIKSINLHTFSIISTYYRDDIIFQVAFSESSLI